jgi:hypothetical protein
MIIKARNLLPSAWLRPITLLGMLALLQACTTTTIDEFRQGATGISSEDSVVILGRRQGAAYETREQFVECVGERMARGDNAINVIPEQQFVDAMFPWFEPRTAPLRSEDLQQLMAQPMVTDIMSGFGVRYIVWLDVLFPAQLGRAAVVVSVSDHGKMIPVLKRGYGMCPQPPRWVPSVLMPPGSHTCRPCLYPFH